MSQRHNYIFLHSWNSVTRWNSRSRKNKTSHKTAQAWLLLAASLEDGDHYLAWEGHGLCPGLPWCCLQQMRALLGHGLSCTEQPHKPQLPWSKTMLSGSCRSPRKTYAAGVLASRNSTDVKRLLTAQNLSLLRVTRNIHEKPLCFSPLQQVLVWRCHSPVWAAAERTCVHLRNS